MDLGEFIIQPPLPCPGFSTAPVLQETNMVQSALLCDQVMVPSASRCRNVDYVCRHIRMLTSPEFCEGGQLWSSPYSPKMMGLKIIVPRGVKINE
jgi:hypothetical protein